MNLERPENGFVLGKFMPPTNGHVYLCDFAQNYCENLYILVCSLPDEPIPGYQRYYWMKELFPNCKVIWCSEVLPQEPKDENDLEFWDIWKKTIRKYTHDLNIDVVFASENYGMRLAEELDASFVPCDLNREAQECSGTAIRNNPYKNWKYIPNVVRPYFVKRVCMFGPESSGKSTLARQLRKHYDTVMVPEYGRIYTEFFGTDVNEEDLENIIKGHVASVKAAKKQSNYILIEDTDPLMTCVWSDMLLGKHDPWFDKFFHDYADLYVLCDVEIPWKDDGTRYFPKQEDRQRFFELCEKTLIERKVKFVYASGYNRLLPKLTEKIERVLDIVK